MGAAEQQAAAEQEVADRALADRARSSEARRAGTRVARSFESTGRFMCLDTSVEEVVRTPSRVGGGARRRSERGAASGGIGSSRDGEASHGTRPPALHTGRVEAPAEFEQPKARRKMRQRGMFSALEQTASTGQPAAVGLGPSGVAKTAELGRPTGVAVHHRTGGGLT